MKKLVADLTADCRGMYIDDLTRASLETLEIWRLAALVKRHGENLA